MINRPVAPPCVKFHVQISPAVRPLSQFEVIGLQGKKIGLWYTPCLKLGLQKSASKLGLLISNQTKKGFSAHVKLGFCNWDYGITLVLKSPLLGP